MCVYVHGTKAMMEVRRRCSDDKLVRIGVPFCSFFNGESSVMISPCSLF